MGDIICKNVALLFCNIINRKKCSTIRKIKGKNRIHRECHSEEVVYEKHIRTFYCAQQEAPQSDILKEV